MTLCTERSRTLDDIRAFLGGNEAADITPHDREAAYAFIERALVRFRYHLGLSRAGKGRVREFLAKVTGYSDSQLSRLIAQQRRTGRIRDHRLRPPARPFATVYTTADAVLLAEVDEAFGQPSGPAIKRILWRQYHVFGDERFERLARISNGHIYNLRGRRAYRSARTTFRATRGAISSIGKRRRPRPEGRPGFVRVDTVHSGDLGGEKGAYVINMVDEVTQFQQLAAVPRITEHFMVPVLAALAGAFPFRVLGFHADNGSEYINHRVAAMLNKLHVEEFTKSRPRRSNDNALVESKNGNVVRRWLGHSHIPEHLAPPANAFLRDFLSPFLNHHRACLFAVEVEAEGGRRRRKYPQELVMTPYEKLGSLPGADGFLKPGQGAEPRSVIRPAAPSARSARLRGWRDLARPPHRPHNRCLHQPSPSHSPPTTSPPTGRFMLISVLENTAAAARRGGTERFGGGTGGHRDGSPEADAVAAGERGGSGPVRPAQGGGRAGQRPDQARPGLSAVLLPGTGGGRGGVGPGVPVPQPAQDVPKPARRGPGRPAPERRGAPGARRTARSVRTTARRAAFFAFRDPPVSSSGARTREHTPQPARIRESRPAGAREPRPAATTALSPPSRQAASPYRLLGTR